MRAQPSGTRRAPVRPISWAICNKIPDGTKDNSPMTAARRRRYRRPPSPAATAPTNRMRVLSRTDSLFRCDRAVRSGAGLLILHTASLILPMRSGLDGGGGQTAYPPRRHDRAEGGRVKGRKTMIVIYAIFIYLRRVSHDSGRGRCRKSSSERRRGEVGHCLVIGRSEDRGVGGWSGTAGLEHRRRVPHRGDDHSIVHVNIR